MKNNDPRLALFRTRLVHAMHRFQIGERDPRACEAYVRTHACRPLDDIKELELDRLVYDFGEIVSEYQYQKLADKSFEVPEFVYVRLYEELGYLPRVVNPRAVHA